MKTLDALFIHPNNASEIYQTLSSSFSAIETPIWAGLLANHCIIKGFNVELMDCEALNMSDEDALHHIRNMNPRLIIFVVYGQQPSASTQNMSGAVRLAEKIKKDNPKRPILFVGGHVSALPTETLEKHSCIDFVCLNEGATTISTLLKQKIVAYDNNGGKSIAYGVPGLCYRYEDNIVKESDCQIISQENLKTELPGIAWHLIPTKHYRTSLWHSYTNMCERTPFASIYTSLGCPFSCSFCCINSVFGGSSFRYWEPEFMIQQFDFLASKNIRNIKIADEMFVLNPKHFLELCKLIIKRRYDFNIWAYARVDTVKDEYLEILRKAGVNWLALGIESGSNYVRRNATKGRFEEKDIYEIVKKIKQYDICVMGNYIFGLPEDTQKSMRETLNLALTLNTEGVNFYCGLAYPGSKLYTTAKEKKWKLPETYSGYSQHSYDIQPLPTIHLTAEEVLRFRDEAWYIYNTNESYLQLLGSKFGYNAVNKTLEATKIKLKRKILGD